MYRCLQHEMPSPLESVSRKTGVLTYDMKLLTPMVGGGVESWKPDLFCPVRIQSIKGILRFWWRTMQNIQRYDVLIANENTLWGCSRNASRVAINVEIKARPEIVKLERDERDRVQYGDLHPYVLFPLQGQKGMDRFTLIRSMKFRLVIRCPESEWETVDKCMTLWVLFGGLGARTRRGCGSLYCSKVMEEFQSGEDVWEFLEGFTRKGSPDFASSHYPSLSNCRFAWSEIDVQGEADPIGIWSDFLDKYYRFRQGPGVGRDTKDNKRPGRTRWPEADTIRDITGIYGNHVPMHPARPWFPRGAYGLPIETEFRNDSTDPVDIKFRLRPPKDLGDRWPSPVILKIIKLSSSSRFLKACLILNHRLPDEIVLFQDNSVLHTLKPDEMPLAYSGKTMPSNAPLSSGQSPYDALIDKLGLQEGR